MITTNLKGVLSLSEFHEAVKNYYKHIDRNNAELIICNVVTVTEISYNYDSDTVTKKVEISDRNYSNGFKDIAHYRIEFTRFGIYSEVYTGNDLIKQ